MDSTTRSTYGLHVPQVCAVVIAGDQPIFTNLERSAESGRRNGRGGPPAFDVVRMELRQVGVMYTYNGCSLSF
jgi:hypothetical protein